jgi:phage tail sheath gpL-like
MANSLVLTISTTKDPAQFKKAGQDQANLVRLINLLSGFAGGALQGTIDIQSDSSSPTAASGTLTLTSAIATDAITIGTVTLTASSTPAGEDEWEIDGADDAADAASLATAINAHSVLSKVVSAEASSNVVTITALQKGVVGNQIPISSADATIVASGSFLSGGTGGAASASESIAR